MDMMEAYKLLDTIIREWSLLVAVFGLGAAWWQGRMWFHRVNTNMEQVAVQHAQQDELLKQIHEKTHCIDNRLVKVENTIERMHEEIHQQEIKLAIIESTASTRRRKTQQ